MQIIMNTFNDIFESFYEKFNIDYYKEFYQFKNDFTNFDSQKKYLSYKDENINYIKLRICDSDEWATILSPFLENDFKIIPQNKTENKYIGDLYIEFKKQYKIPKNYYELISKNEQFLFYYTKEEQVKYLDKFSGKILENTHLPYTLREVRLYIKIIAENTEDAQSNNINCFQSNNPIANNCICEPCMKHKTITKRQNILANVKNTA